MINGTVAVRGAPRDYDRWQELGAPGWGWDAVRPVFERVERSVPIKRYPERWLPFQHAFVEGFAELGYRRVADMNAPDSWGRVVGAWPQNRRNEIRMGTLTTYLREARPRPNLTIRDRPTWTRWCSTARARGIRAVANGRSEEIEAAAVVLSAGAYGTPAILLRSGVGPAGTCGASGSSPPSTCRSAGGSRITRSASSWCARRRGSRR